MHVYCDFDGTITTLDTTDHVLARLARSAWSDLEAQWVAGRISAAQCMREQIALIDASREQLDEVLDEITLTQGFPEFAAWCAGERIPLTVVSDGVEYFIRRILTRHGLGELPVIANILSGQQGAWQLTQPWRRKDCRIASGVCKCAVLPGQAGADVVFIGDGRSDFCVAHRVDVLIAKSALASHARDNGIDFLPFADFHDVLRLVAPLKLSSVQHTRACATSI
jgi:2-hydroxy-3-keto-5-methylthiopentenyl-1-phosphate phosphatase